MRTLLVVGACLICASVAVGQTTSPPLISVTGTAEIKVAPDEVVLRASIETRNEVLSEAKKANDEIATKAISFLKSKGIKEEDIQTDYVYVSPRYDEKKGSTKPAYFTANKSIEVLVKKVELFEPVVTGLLASGVNSVDGITFRHSNFRNLRVQARAAAVKAAKEKADALAAELEVKRGKVYQVEAVDDGGGIAAGYGLWNRSNSFSNVASAVQGGSESDGGGFSLGQISISATVRASFLFE